MKNNVYILASGPTDLIPNLYDYHNENVYWIGVDRGVYQLLQFGIVPDLAVGDFDSVNEEEWKEISSHLTDIHRFQPEKDETDMELAISLSLKKNPSIVRIFGATGGRLDHFMTNALLLSKYQEEFRNIHFEIVDRQNILNIYLPGQYRINKDIDKEYISFIPLSPEVTGLTLTDFKYPLINKTIEFGSSLCMSNELIAETGTFLFEKGILMMIRSKD